jgi:hypothetical protein
MPNPNKAATAPAAKTYTATTADGREIHAHRGGKFGRWPAAHATFYSVDAETGMMFTPDAATFTKRNWGWYVEPNSDTGVADFDTGTDNFAEAVRVFAARVPARGAA